MNDLSMNVEKFSNKASIIHIHGDLTAAAESKLMEAYNQASENNTKGIILDFSHLEYMNSSGIGLLVTLLIRARRNNQRLLAMGLNDHYQQIFELTRLNEAIELFDSPASAQSAIS